MKKFTVTFLSQMFIPVEVEADSQEEAVALAEEFIDQWEAEGHFNFGNLDVCDVEEEKDECSR